MSLSQTNLFDDQCHLFVPYGAPSNACQEVNRTPAVPGIDPCPQLEDHGGVWRFDAHKKGQTQKDGTKYATGIRSVVAMDWNRADSNLYVVMQAAMICCGCGPIFFRHGKVPCCLQKSLSK